MELIAYTGTFVVFQDLDAIINQAREAEDVEAVDDWFADSLTEMYHKQHALLLRRYYDCRKINLLFAYQLFFGSMNCIHSFSNFRPWVIFRILETRSMNCIHSFSNFRPWAFFRILETRSMNCIHSFSNFRLGPSSGY